MAGGHRPVRSVIFDLDGTLVQTRIASWEIFERISRRFDLGITDREQYFDLFRGNVFASIRELCRDDGHAAEVNEAFLEMLRDDYSPPVVPGMAEVVRHLASRCTLAVVSSNAMQVLRRILETNGLAFCFAHVFGGDVTPDKRTAIRAFLSDTNNGFGRRCAADYDEGGHCDAADPASTVLVTDTAGDVRDALDAGIRVVGVAWGMHSVDELVRAGAEFVAYWPQEVAAYVLGDGAGEPVQGACALPARSEPGCRCRPDQCSGCPVRANVHGDPIRDAARFRRDRRRAAAALTAGSAALTAGSAAATIPAAVGDELLAAVRRVCR